MRQAKTRKPRRKIFLIGIVGLVGLLVALWILRYDYHAPTHREIQREFESIAPLPDAHSVQPNDIVRSSGGLVGAYYTSSMPFADVRGHYEKQLQGRGYKFLEFKPLTSWDKDYGEQVLHYCKGQIMAELYNPGTVPREKDYQFSFSISGNAFECR
jgi:hypothetical protein